MGNTNGFTRFDLSGRTAVVTGGKRGIGRAIAVGLAEHGADVVVVDRVPEAEMEEVANAIRGLGRRVWTVSQDLGATAELEGLTEKVWSLTGGIDILVNNAGIAYLHSFDEVSLEQWDRTLRVNLTAAFFLAKDLAARMIQTGRKGRIINISSKNGLVAEAGLAAYNASKGGLELLTQSLAIELGPHGITVNSIAPGIIETELADDFDLDPDFWSYYLQHIPLENRVGTVEDCVGAAIFLAAASGGYITGQHIVIDGGVLCQQVPRLQFMRPGHLKS